MTDNIEMPAFLKREKVTATTAVEITTSAVPAPTGWRARLKVHPAAEMFPLLEPDELRALADDIKANGLLNKATVWWDGHTPVLLDGRNRLDALELAGMMEHSPCGDIAEHLWEPVSNLYENCEHLDPYALVIGLNIHRRHLTREQKRDLIAELLKVQPEKSDRQIAATAKVHHETVGAVRAEQERRGGIRHVETRTDTKGRKQPTKASKPESAADARTRLQQEHDADLERLRVQERAAAQELIQQRAKTNGKSVADDDEPDPSHDGKSVLIPLEGKPKDIAEAILTELGVDKAKQVVRTLDKRLRNIKPDCRFCGGDGLTKPKQAYSVCGSIKYEGVFLRIPCSCDEKMAETWTTEEDLGVTEAAE